MAFSTSLEGDLTTLRPWRRGEGAQLHRIWRDLQVIFWGANPDLAASERQLERILEADRRLPSGQGWVAIVEKATGEVVGTAVLKPAPFSAGELEVGYHLARVAWGRGLASDALRTLVAHARNSLARERLVAAVLPSNLRSVMVLRRAGFGLSGEVLHAGLTHSLYTLGLTARRPAPRC
ncbi:MAG: GNAT family N-acetyltransferase [Myxococcales bacterium]